MFSSCLVENEAKDVANKYLLKSVKKVTMANYMKSRKKWDIYLREKLVNISIPFKELTNDFKTNLVIAYMSHLYDRGLRGIQITSQVSHIKQTYLFDCDDITFFNNVKISQAIKSCRYTTSEIHRELQEKIYLQLLPVTRDMVVKARELYWNSSSWELSARDRKAIYLCIALSYDTGRRISNFIHPSKITEDHCIKTHHVHFIFNPDGQAIPAGPSFRKHMITNKIGSLDIISHALLYFFSQKERCKHQITACQPITISRQTKGQELLLIDLIRWCMATPNDSEEDLLTRNTYQNEMKRLYRAPVAYALKDIAKQFNIDPNRISTSSLRKGYATVSNLNKNTINTNIRAGWTSNSRVPQLHYIKSSQNDGALNYSESNYNIEYLNQFNPLKDK
jgi:hypothetical protein